MSSITKHKDAARFLEACRRVKEGKTHTVFEMDGGVKVLLDMQTAVAVVSVHDRVSERNQAHLLSVSPVEIVDVVWRVIERARIS